jgi:collagenase-like PrtC family protease
MISSELKTELLSPVGDWDCLTAAIKNGADAVYLGVKEFNARLYSRNFSIEELAKVTGYAHNHGIRVYLTMNTLVKNHELKRFFDLMVKVYTAGIDGVIVQHISFLEIIKHNFPGMAVFMSTQAAIGNPSAASLVKSADRVILPRELSLDEIRRFTGAGIPVEVFVHGALCFSYSGLCLFSSFVGSRSGNRGSCAQLCRQKYNKSYPLSTKELCLVWKIPDLIEAGVKGFKIEGRMRSPLYVAVATRLYRKAIDAYLESKYALLRQEMADMEVVFSREFTEGFTAGRTDLTSPEKPMNRGAFLGEVKNGQVVVQRSVAAGDGIGIWQGDNITGNIIKTLTANGKQAATAVAGDTVDFGIELTEGTRVYLTSSRNIKIEPDFKIEQGPLEKQIRQPAKYTLPAIIPSSHRSLELLVKTYSLSEARQSAQAGANTVFLNIFSPEFPLRKDWHEPAKLGAYLPRIMDEGQLNSVLGILERTGPDAILTGNSGFLVHRKKFKSVTAYVDYSFNSFNDFDIQFLRQYNVIPMVSPELSLSEMTALKNRDAVIFCHGDVVLVNSCIDPGADKLTDEKEAHFRVRKESGYWQILNSRPFGLFNDIRKLQEAGFNRFYFDRQDRGAETIKLYRAILEYDFTERKMSKGFTSGHLYKPVD